MLYTASDLAKKLNISRSYLYVLKDNGVININKDSRGYFIWDDSSYISAKYYMENISNKRNERIKKREQKKQNQYDDNLKVQKFYINNRRYLGNKYKLLPFIRKVVDNECSNVESVIDIFAGTGSVASAFLDKKIIVNDCLYSNYVCYEAWFSNESYDQIKLAKLINKYNSINVFESNYMSDNFSNTYFSSEDCKKIGFIRDDIENLYSIKSINSRERALLITSLIYAMDKIAKTCGHYDSYRKNVDFDQHLYLKMPSVDKDQNNNNEFYNCDANELIRTIKADLVYIDPPYNSRQYCDLYHVLENVAKWEKPEVYGVAKKMNRDCLKSDYCTKDATKAFSDLIENIDAKYILLSYNNMGTKGNDRSNAKISDKDIINILSNRGTVKIFNYNYKAFSTGKSCIQDNQERLFLCEITKNKKNFYIPSPLNYVGGKYQLLPQVIPLFPKNINKFIDLFCGGCSVGLNIECHKLILNDYDPNLIGIINSFIKFSVSEVFEYLYKQINKYGLSLSSDHGYDYYGCNSSKGLGIYNKIPFENAKNDFNHINKKDEYYYLFLYLLIIYSFNNQFRFNSRNEFNLPVGKRDFNKNMQKKLSLFIRQLQDKKPEVSNLDFNKCCELCIDKNSFIYADPPYLITCATYNENNKWNDKEELLLLDKLEMAHNKGAKFALSNVLISKGKENNILKNWLNLHDDFHVIYLNKSYSNANYQCKNKDKPTMEVLITNY